MWDAARLGLVQLQLLILVASLDAGVKSPPVSSQPYKSNWLSNYEDDLKDSYPSVPEYEILKIFILHPDKDNSNGAVSSNKAKEEVSHVTKRKTEVFALVKDDEGQKKLYQVQLLPQQQQQQMQQHQQQHQQLQQHQQQHQQLQKQESSRYVDDDRYNSVAPQDNLDFDDEPDFASSHSGYYHQPHRYEEEEYQDIDYQDLMDLIENVPGIPGVDYPILASIPETGFKCRDQRYKGFFADTHTRCQVWYYCDFTDGQSSFLCPNGTVFNQVMLTCDWWFNVDCQLAPQQYVLNERLYKYIKPLTPKFPEDFHGPLVDNYLAIKYAMEQAKRTQKPAKGQELKPK